MKRVEFTEDVVAKWSEQNPGQDLSVLGLTQRLLWAGRTVEDIIERKARSLGFSNRGDYEVAALLRRTEPAQLTAKEVGHRLKLSGPGVVNRLQNLENRGYLIRTPNPEDRRAKRLQLTIEGKAATDSAFASNIALYESLFKSLSPSDKVELDRILKHILNGTDSTSPHT